MNFILEIILRKWLKNFPQNKNRQKNKQYLGFAKTSLENKNDKTQILKTGYNTKKSTEEEKKINPRN